MPKDDEGLGGMVVDPNGYLYYQTVEGILIFGPGAKGHERPIETIDDYWGSEVELALDADGNLYASDDNFGVHVWSNPTTNPTIVAQICLPDQAAGIALSASGVMYVPVQERLKKDAVFVKQFAAGTNACPARHYTEFQSSDPFVPLPLTAHGDRLYEVALAGGKEQVFEFSAKGGSIRKPIAVLSGAPLQVPVGVAVGP